MSTIRTIEGSAGKGTGHDTWQEEHSVWGGKLGVQQGERVTLEDLSVGPLIIAKSRYTGKTTYWRSARTVQKIETGRFTLAFVQNGTFTVRTAAREFSAGDSTLLLLHANTAYRTRLEPNPGKSLEIVSVLIPRHHAMQHVAADADLPNPISTITGPGLVAKRLLDILIENGPQMSAHLLEEHIHLFLSAAAERLRKDPDNPGRHARSAMRFHMVERFVEDHISDPELSAVSAARALNVSSRNLSKIMNLAETSFPELVKRKRLQIAVNLLKSANMADCSVSEISEIAGFRSPSAFFSCFRDAHGCSPGRYRTSSR